jgi:hypothetical protein
VTKEDFETLVSFLSAPKAEANGWAGAGSIVPILGTFAGITAVITSVAAIEPGALLGAF